MRLKNVRQFADREWSFSFAPLTVLCGTNGAGKSTLLKSIILFKQTMGAGRASMGGSGSLVYVGELVDLGNFDTFVSKGDIGRDLMIGIDIAPHNKKHHTRCLTTNFHFGIHGEEAQKSDELSRIPHRTPETPSVLKRAEYVCKFEDSNLQLQIERQSEGKYSLSTDYDLSRLHRDISSEPSLQAVLSGLFPEYLIDGSDYFPLPKAFRVMSQYFYGTIGRINYLKPLRANAARFHVSDPGKQLSHDSISDHLVQMLAVNYNERKEVWNCNPGLDSSPTSQDLDWAFNSWLHYLRTGESETEVTEPQIKIERIKGILLQLSLRSTDDCFYPLADSGFGYSQLLPILTSGLMTDREGTLIVEQPEVHLNPALQVRLAEFLVSMIRCGKQVIIETHSEHMVNAIRTLVAESDDDLEQKCKIHFFSGLDGSEPHCEELLINANGTIANWPKNFFGESLQLSGRLLRAQRRSRL